MGWHHWGSNWHDRVVVYNHDRYYSRSNTFYNRNNYYRGGSAAPGGVSDYRGGTSARANPGGRPSDGDIGGRGEVYNRPGATTKPFNGDTQAARVYGEPQGQSGVHSGAFS